MPNTPPPAGATGVSSPARREDRVLDGEWRAAIADEGLRRVYPDTDFSDEGWESVTVPGHWRDVPAFADHDGSVLHRTRFLTPPAFGPGSERADDADEPRRT
jgi:hypothetical protein